MKAKQETATFYVAMKEGDVNGEGQSCECQDFGLECKKSFEGISS